MKITKKINCRQCPLKCEIYKASKELGLTKKLQTLHVRYKKHEVIAKQGTEVTYAIYLVKGYAKLYIEGLNNRNILLNILRSKDYIGLISFFESVKYSYSVAALEDCQVCMVDLAFVKKLYFSNHAFLIKLNSALGKSVAAIFKKIVSVNQKQIRGRIAESLLYLSRLHNSHKFNLGITRKELGEMAAISEENAVRLLTEFRKEEIISIKGKEIEILDPMLLQRISDFG